MKEIIKIKGLNKTFITEAGQRVNALKNIDLSINEHEFVCLLGPSGSGKSTLLRILAGLERPTNGEVLVMDKLVQKPIEDAGMVFQEYSLMPWRNIIDNVAFGLEIKGVDRKKRKEIAYNILEKFGLGEFSKSFPYELSGGMQQRAAIAKAIINSPQILYMDEPFGALDAHTRFQMQKELIKFWLEDKRTIVFVTHSVEEAIFLGTRVILMSDRPGKIIEDFQIDLSYPRNIWNENFGKYFDKLMDIMNINSKCTE